MIQLFIIGIITAILRAWYNYQVIKKQNWHFSQGLFVGFTFVSFLYLYNFQCIDMEFLDFDTNWQGLINIGLLSVFVLTPHWIVFDITLNLSRGLKWDYYNIDSGSIMDKLGGWQFYIKGFLLFLDLVIIFNFVL